MADGGKVRGAGGVALRKESVDRNWSSFVLHLSNQVALRKESVDRNREGLPKQSAEAFVALRKESVDRNPYLLWQFGRAFVALRKESVDRNWYIWR